MTSSDVLLFMSGHYGNDWDAIFKRVSDPYDKLDTNEINELEIFKQKLAAHGINYVTSSDADYPDVFRNMSRLPFVLYYQGDLSLLQKKQVLLYIANNDLTEYGKSSMIKIMLDCAASEYVPSILNMEYNRASSDCIIRSSLLVGKPIINIMPTLRKSMTTTNVAIKGGLTLSPTCEILNGCPDDSRTFEIMYAMAKDCVAIELGTFDPLLFSGNSTIRFHSMWSVPHPIFTDPIDLCNALIAECNARPYTYNIFKEETK